MDPETLGLLASIRVEKGKPVKPDKRMKKILTEAAAVGNITARAIACTSRIPEACLLREQRVVHGVHWRQLSIPGFLGGCLFRPAAAARQGR